MRRSGSCSRCAPSRAFVLLGLRDRGRRDGASCAASASRCVMVVAWGTFGAPSAPLRATPPVRLALLAVIYAWAVAALATTGQRRARGRPRRGRRRQHGAARTRSVRSDQRDAASPSAARHASTKSSVNASVIPRKTAWSPSNVAAERERPDQDPERHADDPGEEQRPRRRVAVGAEDERRREPADEHGQRVARVAAQAERVVVREQADGGEREDARARPRAGAGATAAPWRGAAPSRNASA